MPGHEGYLSKSRYTVGTRSPLFTPALICVAMSPFFNPLTDYDVAALPEVLADDGYHNLMSGKWHLGYREQHLPSARGFHKSWALLPGCSNHFGWEPAYTNGDIALPRVAGHQPPIYVEDGVRLQP